MEQGTYKTFYYNFLPTKSEEENYRLQNKPWRPTRYVVELRHMNADLVPQIDPEDPWVIKRVVTNQDVSSGNLVLSEGATFSHIFQHWPLGLANSVALGMMRMHVAMCIFTDDDQPPKMYSGPNTYLQKGLDDCSYLLRWGELASERGVNPGDEIGLYWDAKLGAFRFKKL